MSEIDQVKVTVCCPYCKSQIIIKTSKEVASAFSSDSPLKCFCGIGHLDFDPEGKFNELTPEDQKEIELLKQSSKRHPKFNKAL